MSTPARRKATWRLGQREWQVLQRILVVVICLLLFIAFKPIYQRMVETKNSQTCQSNVSRIQQGLANYSNDWDETLPPAEHWVDAAKGNITAASGSGFSVDHLFHCPKDETKGVSYAFNDLLSGLPMTVTGRTQAAEARRQAVGRVDRAPVLIEKHGGAANSHLTLRSWDDVAGAITTPHDLGVPQSWGVLGSGSVKAISREQAKDWALSAQQGDRPF